MIAFVLLLGKAGRPRSGRLMMLAGYYIPAMQWFSIAKMLIMVASVAIPYTGNYTWSSAKHTVNKR
jgi:hypothetical protein